MTMSREEFEKLEKEILENNKMLYCMHSRSCMESCMCWGLEIDKGWINIVDDMSKSLEALNYMFYPKFRVRVQASQVKSKFGELRFYYDIISDPPKWMCIWHDFFQKIFDKINDLDFKMVEVIDRDAYDEVVERELATREEFEKEKKDNARCANVEVFERDDKFIRKATYHHFRRTHCVPTKHKLLHKLLEKRHLIENLLSSLLDVQPTHKQRCISELVDAKAKEIVQKAEKECYEVCEHCGKHIYDDGGYSPRCTTRGWIAYLCKECADKNGSQYIMNGAVWQDGKEIMSREEYAKEKAKIEARFKKAQEKEEKDEDQD